MAPIQDIGHIVLEVGDMAEALRFYRDALGFSVVGKADPVWTVIAVEGGALTLWRKKDPTPCVRRDGSSPFNLHVANFEETAAAIEQSGYPVKRRDAHTGSASDPWNNVVGLHDHREG